MKLIRNGVASVVIVAMPISASFAATRPSVAVPTAGTTAVTAQYDDDRDGYGVAWPALAVIVFTALVAIWIVTKGSDEDSGGDLSPG